jgi:hypothetical protein
LNCQGFLDSSIRGQTRGSAQFEKYLKNRIEIEDAQEIKELEEGLKNLDNKKKNK